MNIHNCFVYVNSPQRFPFLFADYGASVTDLENKNKLFDDEAMLFMARRVEEFIINGSNKTSSLVVNKKSVRFV